MSSSRAHHWRLAVFGLGALLAACAEPAPQAQPVTAPPAAQLEPDVSEALRRMSATIAGAPSFSVRFTTLREVPGPRGQPILLSGTAAVAIRRPDRMVASVGSDLGSFSLYYDGRAFTVLNTHQNVYGAVPMTGPLDAAITAAEQRLGIALPVLPILAVDPYAALTPPGTSGTRIGRSIIRDVVVDHYALSGPNGYWEIWLEAARSGLPLRVSYSERSGEPSRAIIEFEEWNLRARLPDSSFAFTPPRDAVRAEILVMPETPSRRAAP